MKAVIIEDENLIAKELQYKISTVADDVQILDVLTSLKTARKWFMQNAEPDLLFMDIQLSDGVSFELFEHFKLNCPVIFTTAYDEYAIRAFKVNGIDYLLKPVDTDELQKAIDKCRTMLQQQPKLPSSMEELMKLLQNPLPATTLYKEKFVVSVRNNWIPVLTKDIACFVRDNLNYLYTFSGEKYILDYVTLEEIEELLDPKYFYRANRQSIVHIDAIQTIKPHENQKLTLTLKAPLKMEQDVSREKAPAFKRWFER
ncbi:response regulator transcription factor [Lacibacter luteus]|uniref:Response regulator transcription factor n=1 Tax=Lacibacter luteus TaxID=2508719 RepID=A0A4Q1CFH6_9BACT|nr:LytTR family DNA-binding domain-containing protein [Lacibacter luteus]RXK58766.1 response regulator transcription factor [Lacibacter luteus]